MEPLNNTHSTANGRPLEQAFRTIEINGTIGLKPDFSQLDLANGLKFDFLHGDADTDKESLYKKSGEKSGNIAISRELFERMYLDSHRDEKPDVRKRFANPTPVGVLGILLSLTPLSCDLMGWRGASQAGTVSGAASIGAYFFFGGILLLFSGTLEFLVGNTFSFVVFMSFAAFWLTLGATLQPGFNAFGAYAPAGATVKEVGLLSDGFNASIGFFMLFMGLLCLVYLVCSLRTNVVYVVVFSSLVVAFGILTAQHFEMAKGNFKYANDLQVAAGASLFITSMALWWIFASIMLEVLDFPFKIPVGDISWIIKGASARAAEESSIV